MTRIADENVEVACVNWLRDSGHDVSWAAETMRALPDLDLLELAHQSMRVLLTRDRDFGQIVFSERRLATGIILLRFRARNQWERLKLLQSLWPAIEQNALGRFVVVHNDRLRIRPLRMD